MLLANYATDPTKTKGRLYPESPTMYRNEFQRDKDRIVHSNIFRRLQYKTQVFINHEGDHYRNRLTHSIEVASIARSVARDLGASEDLAESIALAHDLGHTPFGHAGEDALKECMKDYGGFCHNAQAIKLVTELEKRYAAYEGLNLTWEVIEGLAKHNGPLVRDIPIAIKDYDEKHDLNLDKYSSIEAQIASMADDITYNCHDLEDGIRAGMIEVDELSKIYKLDEITKNVLEHFPNVERSRCIFEIVRELAHILIEDLLAKTKDNLKKYNITSSDQVRILNRQLVEFSDDIMKIIIQIRDFLGKKVYKHHKVVLLTYKCKKIVAELFKLYFENPECMPLEWQQRALGSENTKARAIADFIAGMTDRYAIKQYNSLSNFSVQISF